MVECQLYPAVRSLPMVPDVLAVVAGYLLGCFPTAALVGRRSGHDPHAEGSGNPGATNVYRVAGAKAGVLVLLGDMLKGAVAGALGVVPGAAAVLGHVLPVGRWGRGGKGVATAAGMAAVASPWVALVAGLVWLAAAVVGRRASLASMLAMAALPVGSAGVGRSWAEVGALAGVAVLVVARHHENIRRLLRGDEPKLAYRRRP